MKVLGARFIGLLLLRYRRRSESAVEFAEDPAGGPALHRALHDDLLRRRCVPTQDAATWVPGL
jgi:hypothetical protein